MPATDFALPEPELAKPAEMLRVESPAETRVFCVDLLRGVVMILMAVDHAHFFFRTANSVPEYLPDSSPAQFFTRWITHFCAPWFIFLAGTSAFLLRSAASPGPKSHDFCGLGGCG